MVIPAGSYPDTFATAASGKENKSLKFDSSLKNKFVRVTSIDNFSFQESKQKRIITQYPNRNIPSREAVYGR